MSYFLVIEEEDGFYWMGRDKMPIGPYRTRQAAVDGFIKEDHVSQQLIDDSDTE